MQRLWLFSLVFLPTISLFGQSLIDTSYNRWGGIAEIRYGQRVPAHLDFSKMEMFQRGLKVGDYYQRLDSIREYDSAGNYLRTSKEPRKIMDMAAARGNTVAPSHKPSPIPPRSAEDSFEGRIGSWVERPIRFAGSREPLEKMLAGRQDKEKIKLRVVHQKEEERPWRINAKAQLPGGYRTHVLRFTGPDGEAVNSTLVLRGYHLNESDFVAREKVDDNHLLDMRNEETLYLRLRSTEKLMFVYDAKDKLVQRQAVGRQIDEVDLHLWPAGRYMLEIRDLRTGSQRFYGVQR